MSSSKKIWAYSFSTFVVLILLEVTFGQDPPSLGFGKSCNTTVDLCDLSEHLKCTNGTNNYTCLCNNLEQLYYNGTNCVAYAGKQCGGGSTGYKVECTVKSWCKEPSPGQGGVCQCDFDYMNAPDGKCYLTHDAAGCQRDNDCNQHAFLRCSYGTCKCELNNATYVNQVWDEDGDPIMCRSLVGADCTRTGYRCVENAGCHGQNNRTCACDLGFEANAERYCLIGLGKPCNVSSECASNKCDAINATIPGNCVCPDGKIEVNGKCFSLPEESCTNTEDCVANADCIRGVCQCHEGFSIAGSKCSANYGTVCSIPSLPEEDICNSDIYLVCKNETNGAKCSCDLNYQYHNTLGRCQGLYGVRCTTDRASDCFLSTTCVENPTTGNSTCQCLSDLVKGEKEQVCRATYGKSCDVYGCYNDGYQVCQNSSCACESEDLTVSENQQNFCVGKIDTNCDKTPERPMFCPLNAACQGEELLLKQCKCNTDFHASENRTVCLPGNGSAALGISATVISIFFIIVKLF